MVRYLAALTLTLALAGCGDPCPEVAMTDGPEGLVIVQEEHPDGWGHHECTACHALEALHRRGCTEGVDLAMVREQVDDEGLEACATCHGENEAIEEEPAEEEAP